MWSLLSNGNERGEFWTFCSGKYFLQIIVFGERRVGQLCCSSLNPLVTDCRIYKLRGGKERHYRSSILCT